MDPKQKSSNSEPTASHDSSDFHPTSSILTTQAHHFVDLAQVTSEALVNRLTSPTHLQTPTTSDSSVLISSSLEFNQYRDVDVQSLASSRRTDLSNASTAHSHAVNPGLFDRSMRDRIEVNQEQVANDNGMASSSDGSVNDGSGSTTQMSVPGVDVNREEQANNQAADNEIANITDIWLQEENQDDQDQEEQANAASPVFSNEDSNSNLLDDASLQNNAHSQDHFSIHSSNEESFADNSNHSPSSGGGQQTGLQGSPQMMPQTLPQSTLTPMPLTGASTSTSTNGGGSSSNVSQLSSQPPENAVVDTPAATSSTSSSNLNDTSVRTSSILISNNTANESTGSTNSISHYSIFTRIRSQPNTSQSNLNQTPTSNSSSSQPSQSSSKHSLVTSSTKQSSKLHSKQSTFKFEPKNPSFHKLVEEYYKEFAEETDPLNTSSTLRDTTTNQLGFSSTNENYLAFYKLSKLFLRHENYYCTMLLPFNRVYKYKNQDGTNDFLTLDSSSVDSEQLHHHLHQRKSENSSKMLNSLVNKFKSSDDANSHINKAKLPVKTPLNQDDFEAMIAVVTGVNNHRSKQQNENSSNSSCQTSSHRPETSSNMQPLPEDQYDLFGERKTSPTSNMLQKSSEFFTCSLCSHYLYEPITLVCGCSYCRNCLIEYNKTLERMKFRESAVEMRQRKKRSSTDDSDDQQKLIADDDAGIEALPDSLLVEEFNSDTSDDDEEEKLIQLISEKSLFPKYSQRQNKVILYQCYNCGKTHDQNTSEHLKINVFISKLVDRLWAKSVDARQLRMDIRHFICYEMELFDKFNLHKYEYLLKQAYEMDKSNHLILADLFMINYFSGCLENCLKYADMVVQLRPNWPFSYYMRAIYYRKMNDIYRLKSNLILCLHLDPSIEQIRVELFQVLMLTNHNLMSDSTSVMCPYTKKIRANNQLSAKGEQSDDIYDYNASKSSCAPIKRARSFNCDNSQGESTSMSKHQKFSVTPPKDTFSDSNSTDSMNSYQDDKTCSESAAENSGSKQSSSYSPPSQRQRSTLNTVNQDSQAVSFEEQQKAAEENSKYLSLNSSLIKIADLECSLCYRLILNPVTTPCGHSFCCSCLDRSLDHQDKCPLCKHSLADYLAERRSSTTSFIEKLIRIHFPNEYNERKNQHEEELKDLSSDDEIPIFVCTLALPNAPCPLHIYEPRYRLMLRRAIETGSREFGMCMYSERTQHRYTEYGCLLKIHNFQFSRDGRAIVHSTGGRRFKVVKSSTKDGYNVAKVEWVKDERATSPQEVFELQQIHDEVYQLSLKWYSFIPHIQKNKILEIYGMGEIPAPDEDIQANDNGPAWHWFVLSILPLENDFQYKFLTKTSLKDRLSQMKKIISILLRPFDTRSSSLPTSLSNSSNNLAAQPEELTTTQSSSARSSPNQQT